MNQQANFENQNLDQTKNKSSVLPSKNTYKILFFVTLGLFLTTVGSLIFVWLTTFDAFTQLMSTKPEDVAEDKPTDTEIIAKISPTIITETSSVSAKSITPSNWKTYSSKELSLSFKYPSSWGEPESEVVDFNSKGYPFYGKAVFITFKNSSEKNRISVVGVSKDYKNYIDLNTYIGNQSNLDLPETFNQQEGYFTKKMTVADQKTAIKTSLEYLIEASGVEIKSSTKLNGNNEYTGITVTATYLNFNEILNKYYDATENKGLISAAIELLIGLKDNTSSDKEMNNLYKDYQTFLSTFTFN